MDIQKKNQSLDVNDTLAKSEAYFIKYKKQIITAIVAIVVLVGGSFAYVYGIAKPNEEKAQESLGIVMQKYVMTQDFEHALKGEGKTLGLVKIADKYSSTDAGNVAKGLAGICSYQLGKTDDAIKYLESFSPKGDETVSAQMLSALANAYASKNRLDDAVKTFKKAAEATDIPALCSEALFQSGLILEKQNKKDEALKTYQDIKKNYPSAPLCSRQQQNGVVLDAVIDKYIARLSN